MDAQTLAALSQLEQATKVDEVNAGCEALCAALGLPKFFYVLHRHLGGVALVGHNGPSGRFKSTLPLHASSTDPLVARSRASPVPFVWSEVDYQDLDAATAEAYRFRATAGFRSGICATLCDANRERAILVLASDATRPPRDDDTATMGTALLASNYLLCATQRATAVRVETNLTPRELDCLQLVLSGLRAKDIARHLDISPRSVNQYLERARSRLHVDSSFQAARIAADQGLITMDGAQVGLNSVASRVG